MVLAAPAAAQTILNVANGPQLVAAITQVDTGPAVAPNNERERADGFTLSP
jgi:hypothetical protein